MAESGPKPRPNPERKRELGTNVALEVAGRPPDLGSGPELQFRVQLGPRLQEGSNADPDHTFDPRKPNDPKKDRKRGNPRDPTASKGGARTVSEKDAANRKKKLGRFSREKKIPPKSPFV